MYSNISRYLESSSKALRLRLSAFSNVCLLLRPLLEIALALLALEAILITWRTARLTLALITLAAATTALAAALEATAVSLVGGAILC